jgi:hypothetical protein
MVKLTDGLNIMDTNVKEIKDVTMQAACKEHVKIM